MLPSFALLTISTISAYIDSDRMQFATAGQAEIGKHKWILDLLAGKEDLCVRADVGAFVFKTKQGYGLLHALQRRLEDERIRFTLVHFEGDLFGSFHPQSIPQLERLGVAVHQIGI